MTTNQSDAGASINGHAIHDLFLKWSEWTTELGEAISRKNIDGFVRELRAVIAAGGAAQDERRYTQADMERYGKCYADARDARRGAAQEPIYQVRDDVQTWIDVDEDMFERSQQEDRRIVYAVRHGETYLEGSNARVAWDAWRQARAAQAASTTADALTYQDGLRAALEAVRSEYLTDPTEEHGDVVYQRAVADCENGVAALLREAGSSQ